jgi:multisubunit Na+/H+ antiporter MnhB subunit
MAADATLLDALLAATLLWLGWRALASADLYKAVVQFMVFGLLLALAWVRLGAPDIALAEAAIGAGLAGALLLDTLARLGAAGAADEPRPLRLTPARAGIALASLLLVALLAAAWLALPAQLPGLAPQALAALPASGVSNPVTATLLNYRAWDTLLEIGVLLLAVLGVWILDAEPPLPRPAPDPMLGVLLRIVLPLSVVAGGYLLWVGSHAPGGAFQAAALLAAGGVLWHLAQPLRLDASLPARAAVVAGFAVFLAVGVATAVLGAGLLTLPPAHAGALILAIEAVATVSIALIMVALFAGRAPVAQTGDAPG